MENLADLEQAADALVVVTRIFVDAHPVHPIDGVLAVLSSTISQLEGFRTRLIGRRGITDRSALAAEFGLACAEAAQLEKAAQRLPSLGPLLRAVESGDVSMSKARMVAEVVTRTRTEEGERDGDRLTELAIELHRTNSLVNSNFGPGASTKNRASAPLRICDQNDRWRPSPGTPQ